MANLDENLYIHIIAHNAFIHDSFNLDDFDEWIQDDLASGIYHAMMMFINRVDTGAIKVPFTYEEYKGNKDIIDTLNGYGIDIEEFWYAILFIYDLTIQKCVNGAVTGDTVKVQVELLRNILASCDTIAVSGGKHNKMEINDSFTRNTLTTCLDNLLASGQNLNYGSGDFMINPVKCAYPASVQMWYASTIFFKLFKKLNLPDKRAKDSAVVYRHDKDFGCNVAVSGGHRTVSFNKTLLVSRLIFLMRMTKTEAFIHSDNSLKGIMRHYKNFKVRSLSLAYDY